MEVWIEAGGADEIDSLRNQTKLIQIAKTKTMTQKASNKRKKPTNKIIYTYIFAGDGMRESESHTKKKRLDLLLCVCVCVCDCA